MKAQVEIPKGYLYYTRKFLNKPGQHSIAYIFATLNDSGYSDPVLQIGDCTRSISISLEAYSPESVISFENSITKLATMERAIRGLRMAMLKKGKAVGYGKGDCGK